MSTPAPSAMADAIRRVCREVDASDGCVGVVAATFSNGIRWNQARYRPRGALGRGQGGTDTNEEVSDVGETR